MKAEEKHWLTEELKSVKNLCDISILLIELDRLELLPTTLEYLYEQGQHMVDNHCVVRG